MADICGYTSQKWREATTLIVRGIGSRAAGGVPASPIIILKGLAPPRNNKNILFFLKNLGVYTQLRRTQKY